MKKRIITFMAIISMVISMVPSNVFATDFVEPQPLLAMATQAIQTQEDFVDTLNGYNVKWTTQSANSSESMPVGGGDIGLNVWVEDNSIYFYIGKSDTYAETNVPLKLGRVKIDLDPNPFEDGTSFRQELMLHDGYCEIAATGKDGNEVTIQIWVDVFNPVIHVEVDSVEPVKTTAEYQTWRYEDRVRPVNNVAFDYYRGGIPYRDPSDTYIDYGDTIDFVDNSVMFYHKNNNDDLAMNFAMDVMKLTDNIDMDTWYDPVSDFTCGGIMDGQGMVAQEITDGAYGTTPHKGYPISNVATTSQDLAIYLHTGQYEEADQWVAGLKETVEKDTPEANREASENWWHDFWERSHITVDTDLSDNEESYQVGRNYNLFRYMLGCNAYGNQPTKFNGGFFTWDGDSPRYGVSDDPDYRAWGAGVTAQNQRHMYWPMLKSGDSDMMAPQFDFYENSYKNAEQTVQEYYGHRGTMYSENTLNYGLPSIGHEYINDFAPDENGVRHYETGEPMDDGVVAGKHIRFEYVQQLDAAAMMLENQKYFGSDISQYVDFIESATYFYLDHYKYRYQQYTELYEGGAGKDADGFDEDGDLVIYPSCSVETYKNVLNPTDVCVALYATVSGLIRLYEEDPTTYGQIDIETWRDMLDRIPEINITTNSSGNEVFAPGYHPGDMGVNSPYYENGSYFKINQEAAELSIVYPYNMVSLGRDGVDIGIETYNTQLDSNQKNDLSWKYTNVVVARLGMVDEAEDHAIAKLSNGPYRFPSFWGPGHDWSPDHNWGGTGMSGLQEMAMQCYDDVIQPFACWPTDWNGTFKLHANQSTVVEAEMQEGTVETIIIDVAQNSTRKSVELQYTNCASGIVVDSHGDVVETTKISDDAVSFATQPGTTYYLMGMSTTLLAPKMDRPERTDEGHVDLCWSAVTGAESYTVYRCDLQENSMYTVLAENVEDTTYVDENANGGPYAYTVVANRGGEQSSQSNIVELTVWGTLLQYDFETDIATDSTGDFPNNTVGTVTQMTHEDREGSVIYMKDAEKGYLWTAHDEALDFEHSFSVEISVYLEQSPSGYDRLIDKYGTGTGFLLDLSPNRNVRVLSPGVSLLSDAAVPLNQWSTIRVEYNQEENKVSIFLDDVEIASGDLAQDMPNADCPLRFGVDQNGNSRFTGYMDDISIKTFIPESKTVQLPPEVPADAMALYRFQSLDDGVLDATGNGYIGTATSDVLAVADGIYGNAAQFAESGTINLPASLAFTDNVELSFYVKSQDTEGTLLEKSDGFRIYLDDGKVKADVGQTVTLETNEGISAEDFTKIIFGISNGRACLIVGETTVEQPVSSSLFGSGAITLGGGFVGQLDELEIASCYYEKVTMEYIVAKYDKTVLTIGDTANATVSIVNSDGSTTPVSDATFQTSDASIAEVSADGSVKGVAAGTVTITATHQGKTVDVVLDILESATDEKYFYFAGDVDAGGTINLVNEERNGTIQGNVTIEPGLFGGTAYSMGGGKDDGIILSPYTQHVDEFALEMWVKPTGAQTEMALFDSHTGNSGRNGMLLQMGKGAAGGVSVIYCFDTGENPHELSVSDGIAAERFNTDYTVVTPNVEQNKWSHIKLVADSEIAGADGHVILYVDGQKIGEGILTAPIYTTGGKIKIGGRGNNTNNYAFVGLMDEIQMYDYDGENVPTLEKIELKIGNLDVAMGKTTSYQVLGTLTNGRTMDLTPIATVTASETGAITTTQEGILTKNTNEDVTLTASAFYDDVEKTSETVNLAVSATTTYSVTATAGEYGSVSPESQSVLHGENVAITIAPDPGYEINCLFVNGTSVTISPKATEYMVEAVRQNITLEVTFTETPALNVVSTVLSNGIMDETYSQAIVYEGGILPVTFAATGLPTGLSINSETGIISGKPTIAGTFDVEITITDANQETASATISLTVTAKSLLMTTTALPMALCGNDYEATVKAYGGVAPYTWTATGLPVGLEMAADTGILSGVPTTEETVVIQVVVEDSLGKTVEKSFSLEVAENVPAKQLEAAKTVAIAKIEVAQATYQVADYRAAQWTELTAIFTDAKAAVNALTTVADVEAYAITGLTAAADAIKTDAELTAEEEANKPSGGTSTGGTTGSTTTTTTTTNGDGTTTKVVTDKKTGTVTETTKQEDCTVVKTTDGDGGETTKVTVTGTDATVKLHTDGTPGAGDVVKVTYGDGSTELITKVNASEDGLTFQLPADATVEIVDNSKDFADVQSSDWFSDAVDFVTSRNLFAGTSATTFDAGTTMSRQMSWVVLARLSGEEMSGANVYADAKAWAVENGVSDGSNETGDVTREQLVTLLWRNAGSPSSTYDLSAYDDSSNISDYAKVALAWAVESGIISGVNTATLDPQGNTTRGQMAQIMKNHGV